MYLNVPSILGALAAATTVSADYLDVMVFCLGVSCSNPGGMSSQP